MNSDNMNDYVDNTNDYDNLVESMNEFYLYNFHSTQDSDNDTYYVDETDVDHDVYHVDDCADDQNVLENDYAYHVDETDVAISNDVENVHSVDDQNVHDVYAYNVNCPTKCNMWCVDLAMTDSNSIHFKIDTQGDVTVIPLSLYKQLKFKPVLTPSATIINGFGGARIKSQGTVVLPVKTQSNKVYFLRAEVVPCKCPAILSDSDSVALGLVKRVFQYSNSNPASTQAIIAKYHDVNEGVGCIPGEYSLKCDDSVKPVAHPPRPVPAALREAVKAKLKSLEECGIIERVPVGTPTPWCSSLHVVLKKNRKDVRITIDPKDLNRALLREYHPILTVEDVITRTHGSKYFTVLDAQQGFFQIKLDQESALLTAFNTPFGRYFYKRLPMGISSAPEIYQRAMTDLFKGIDNVEIVMDDILVHGSTLEAHNKTLETVLQRCRDNNLKLNSSKTKLAQNEVEYVGQLLTPSGVKIAPSKVRAVLEMPSPKNINNVHTLLGMVNYTMKFLPELSAVTEPLRLLLKESNTHNFKFHWDPVHEQAFQKLKSMMTAAPVLRYYSLTEPVTISCDASQSGLGMVLLQGGKPVAYGSKSLTNAEYAYSQIEKELLAIVSACNKFHTYIYGRHDVTVETDHLPLIRIFEKPLHLVPLRLQKMLMRLQQYHFTIVHKPGKEIPVPDNLSRLPIQEYTTDDYPEFSVMLTDVRSTCSVSTQRLTQIREDTQADKALQVLIKTAQNGWPSTKKETDELIRPYWDFREEINILDGIVLRGERIIVPYTQQKEILSILHESHQGIVKMKQLAKDLIYWPGINGQIEDMVSKCGPCQKHRKYQIKEPLVPSEVPKGPWQHLAADLFDCNKVKYLIVADYYSEWFDIANLGNNTTASAVIKALKSMFSTHGIPVKLLTDNGPPFNSEAFKQLAQDFDFQHVTMSPYHSQTNGLAEKTVDIAKNLIIKCTEDGRDISLALLNVRNTPGDIGSPAQRLMGRRTRTLIPTSFAQLQPATTDPQLVTGGLDARRQLAKSYYDRGSKPLPPLQNNDVVRIRNQQTRNWEPAQLLENQPQLGDRSYIVTTPDGSTFRRNRRDLLKTREDDPRISPGTQENSRVPSMSRAPSMQNVGPSSNTRFRESRRPVRFT